jgi:hypothetical protein
VTPGSLILLHTPGASSAAWGDLPEMLRSYGLDVIAPDIREDTAVRYVARASLVIAATAPTVPLVLVGYAGSGPLLPALATAQRAAHRPVGGYVFVDSELPAPGGDGEVPVPADWPEAPCGYLVTVQTPESPAARQARLRGWQVRILAPAAGESVAQALSELVATL